jgi:hypothetical protein
MASQSECHKGTFRNFISVAAFFCLLVLPALGRAENKCPWMNEATASGILGGEAMGMVTGSGAEGATTCEFTQLAAGFRRTLSVTVEVTPDAHTRLQTVARNCGGDAAPLKAIGNEALFCPIIDHKNGQGEFAVGRVRDQVFTITIKTTLKDDPILTRATLIVRIDTAAEQIAGNLF